MPDRPSPTVRELLLTRRGLASIAAEESSAARGAASADAVRAVALELAEIGYVPSSRLEQRLSRCSPDTLRAFRDWSCPVLLAHAGGDRRHIPLFRRFPEGIPADTVELWWKKVLVHFLQDEAQPCLFCGRTGTTHVLDPCGHVVCDHCFDGTSYSACPSCEHHVDRSSPFFREAPVRGLPSERVIFKRIDLAEDLEAEARALFVSLCERKQALSPADREALAVLVREYKGAILSWLPPAIPVRENVAVVFGTLFREYDPALVLPQATRFMTTATDVLRFLAVFSGTDGSLLPETITCEIHPVNESLHRFWGRIAELLGVAARVPVPHTVHVPIRVRRFKVARLSRPLRRAMLAILESLHPERMTEDMLRHRSYWVWLGEFLHPHEYAARFPNVARAFQVVRGKAPDGTPAPPFPTWYARVEQRMQEKDVPGLLAILAERPGELARRLDQALRIAGDDQAAVDRIAGVFTAHIRQLATPVLLTLGSHIPRRNAPAPIRVYWPKGRVAMGASTPDRRAVLPHAAIESIERVIRQELLRRFAEKPAFAQGLIDDALRTVMVPFNERTASPAAVSLPRGSRIAVPPGKTMRLFLHWCQPEKDGRPSDLDLSVAFYNDDWTYAGVCAYYQLRFDAGASRIATSAGDLRDAPWPDGASEFVDVHRDPALAAGIRYAVMVVNNYAGLPFSQLERGFAGLMLRDDQGGQHFDPRTVELKFNVGGENGIFLPLVLDLGETTLHWLDVQVRGELEMNNVEKSKTHIGKVCPELMAYFASGTRTSMFELALLHAAARCSRVLIRGESISEYVRGAGESIAAFHERLRAGAPDRQHATIADDRPLLAMLYRGDVELPEGSSTYALFREQVIPTLAAGDLLSA